MPFRRNGIRLMDTAEPVNANGAAGLLIHVNKRGHAAQ
jgi:hypothetical protein